jgi:arylformamidase
MAKIESKDRRFEEVFDISIALGKENATYPGDSPYKREELTSIASGAKCNISTLTLCAHSGTHIDAPAHFLDNAFTIDKYPVRRFILSAHVVNVRDEISIKPDALHDLEVEKGDALLFKTFNSISCLSTSGLFSKHYVYMSEDAAKLCIDLEVGLVGIDYLSVDRYKEETSKIHRILLKNDVLILENIDLKDVPVGKYTLFCPPLKISNGEASPVRALLFR